jgi:peptidoglycan biosynthesis protein MviN/MurJ (putative lipid II flippase)
MKWSTEERQGFLRKLDAIDSVVVTFYRLLLGLVIAAVVIVVVLVVIHRPWGDGNQGEWFYFSIAVIFVLGWAIGQLFMLDRRQRKRRPPVTWTWQFRCGPAAGETLQNDTTSDEVERMNL